MAEARAAVKLAVVQAVGLVVARETAMRADEVVLVVANLDTEVMARVELAQVEVAASEPESRGAVVVVVGALGMEAVEKAMEAEAAASVWVGGVVRGELWAGQEVAKAEATTEAPGVVEVVAMVVIMAVKEDAGRARGKEEMEAAAERVVTAAELARGSLATVVAAERVRRAEVAVAAEVAVGMGRVAPESEVAVAVARAALMVMKVAVAWGWAGVGAQGGATVLVGEALAEAAWLVVVATVECPAVVASSAVVMAPVVLARAVAVAAMEGSGRRETVEGADSDLERGAVAVANKEVEVALGRAEEVARGPEKGSVVGKAKAAAGLKDWEVVDETVQVVAMVEPMVATVGMWAADVAAVVAAVLAVVLAVVRVAAARRARAAAAVKAVVMVGR